MLLQALARSLETASSLTLTVRRTPTGNLLLALLPEFPALPSTRGPAADQERARFAQHHTPLILSGPAESLDRDFVERFKTFLGERSRSYQEAVRALQELQATQEILGPGAPASKARDTETDEATDLEEEDTPEETEAEEVTGAEDDLDDPAEDEPRGATAPQGKTPASAPSKPLLPLFEDEP